MIGSRTPRGEFVANADACTGSDIVFLSVPPQGVEATASDLADELAGRIVVSVASPVVFRDGKPAAAPGRALARRARRAGGAPGARRRRLPHGQREAARRPDQPLDEDVLLCGDDAEAKEVVAGLAERLVRGAPWTAAASRSRVGSSPSRPSSST